MDLETLSPPVAPPRRRGPYATGVAVFVAARLVTLVAVALADLHTHHGLVHELSRWDGEWFLRAAGHGWPSAITYVDGHVAGSTIAFFPLFPLLLRGLHDLTGLSGAVVGLVVSALSGLAATVGVGALTRSYADDDSARRATILFALSPGAYVFSLIYNEGLVVLLCVTALWALSARRWWVAGAAGAISTALSPVGLVLVAPAAWVALSELRRRRVGALGALVATPLGFAAWTGYLWAHTGTPRAWSLTERGGWNSYPSLAYPAHILWRFVSNPVSPTMTGHLLLVGMAATAAGLVVLWRERLATPAPVTVYAFAAALVFAVSAPVGLRPRFLMLVFPIVMAVATRYRGRVFAWVCALSGAGLLFMSFQELHSWAIFP